MSFQPGYYKIEAKHSQKVMAVAGALLVESASIIQWDWNNGDDQKFWLTEVEPGYYRLACKHSKKVVAIAGASNALGGGVIQFTWKNGQEQKFKITKTEGEYYKIEAKHSGQALAIGAGATHSGAGVIQWPYGGGADQQWKMTCVEPLSLKGGIPWAVSLHPVDIARNPTQPPSETNPYSLENAGRAFDFIKDLGASLVRTDYNWFDVEPTQGTWDQGKIDFYKRYTDLAREKGLGVICILFQPPSWAVNLSTPDVCDRYFQYCQKMAGELKGKVQHFQLWNDPNSPAQHIGSRTDEEYANLFLAGNRALHEVLGDDYTAWINLNCNWPEWANHLEGYFKSMAKHPEHKINIGIDHYPGTWAASQWYDWTPLDVLVRDFIGNPSSACYGRLGAIMETGYTTPPQVSSFPGWDLLWRGHTEEAQAGWIYEQPVSALPELYRKIHAYRSSLQVGGISFCGWYELYDADTGYGGSIDEIRTGRYSGYGAEQNFGIVHTDCSKKPGFDKLRTVMQGFSNANLKL